MNVKIILLIILLLCVNTLAIECILNKEADVNPCLIIDTDCNNEWANSIRCLIDCLRTRKINFCRHDC